MSPVAFVIIAVSVSFVLSLVSWGKYLLYPFRIFTTWAHECSHGVMATLTGGEVKRITLAPDTSGLCVYQLPPSRLRRGLVASAGYLGSCLVGCAIYLATAVAPAYASLAMTVVGALMLVSLVFWVRNGFGMVCVLALGVALVTLGRGAPNLPLNPVWVRYGLSFLGIQTALQAVFDLRELFAVRSKSDAHTMQSLFWLPAPFWAVVWIGMSAAMVGWVLVRYGVR